MRLIDKVNSQLAAVFKPPVFDDAAKTQQALVLHVNLWFGIFAQVLVALLGLANPEMLTIYASSAVITTLWFAFLLGLTHRGRTVSASWLSLASIWTMTTAFCLVGGGLAAPILSEYLVSIIVAGLLLGWRMGVRTTVASLVACTAFAWLEARQMLPRQVVSYTPSSTLLIVIIVSSDIAMLLVLAVYSIGKSFRRAERELAERRHAEEALRAKTEELDRFFSFSLDLLCIADIDGHFRRLNPAWRVVFGYEAEELDGGRLLDFVHPDDLPATREVGRALARGENISGFVNRYRCKDGSYRWIEWQATPYEGSLVFAAARDITERRRAEEDRVRMDSQLQQSQKLESLGILAGGIAHDFNNLLAGIVGNADIILADLPEDTHLRPMAETILEIAQRASGLCTQMLAYSGRGMVPFEPTDLNRAVMEMERILDASTSKRAEVRHVLAENLPLIDGDPTQIRQVVMNLVLNAVESLEDKTGEICVTTGMMHCSREYLRGVQAGQDQPPGDYIYLEVLDTGHGMDAATIARIFDPFFSTKFTGRGLGLAAVLGIVRNHGGALDIDSTPGRGTTFRVMFPPMHAAAPVPAKTSPGSDSAWRGQGTVLLVDDETSVRTIGTNLLKRLGFEVAVAENGRRAVDLYSGSDGGFDCVILDLTMPQMNGEETFRELRRLGCSAPIIITSGYSEYEAAERFAGQDTAGFLQKPYRMERLRNVLQAALKT